MGFNSGFKGLELGPSSYLLCNVCEVSHRMGKWLAPNAIRHPDGLREPKYHLSNCYFRLTNVTGVTSRSKHTHLQRGLSHTVKSYLPKPPEYLTFSECQLWFWRRSWTARRGQCWLRSDIWSKMFLISIHFIMKRRF